jgi:hypothetical protein
MYSSKNNRKDLLSLISIIHAFHFWIQMLIIDGNLPEIIDGEVWLNLTMNG